MWCRSSVVAGAVVVSGPYEDLAQVATAMLVEQRKQLGVSS